METEAYAASRSQRKKIERLFAEVKRILALVRLRLRGLAGAKDEFLLTATVQNLKRLATTLRRAKRSALTNSGHQQSVPDLTFSTNSATSRRPDHVASTSAYMRRLLSRWF